MKIRNGFVSNSSSSSYIISFDQDMGIDIDILREYFVERYETCIDCFGSEQVIKEMMTWHNVMPIAKGSWLETRPDYVKREFIAFMGIAGKIEKEVSSGKNVALISIAYGDDDSYYNLDKFNIVMDFG